MFEWPSDEEISSYLGGLTPFRDLPDDGIAERRMLEDSGRSLANRVMDGLRPGATILVVAGPADYDAFASALVSMLIEQGCKVKLACLWLNANGMVEGQIADRSLEDTDRIVVARSFLGDPARVMPLLVWSINRATRADCLMACHRGELETIVEVTEFPMVEGRSPVAVLEQVPVSLERRPWAGERAEEEKALQALEMHLDRGDHPCHTPDFVDAWFQTGPNADRTVPADGGNP